MNGNIAEANIHISISEQEELLADIEIFNSTGRDLNNWHLEFDLPKEIRAGGSTRLLNRVGSHVWLVADNNTLLKVGGSHTLQFRGHPGIIHRLSDLPTGLYIHSRGENIEVKLVKQNLTELEDAEILSDYGGVPQSYTGSAPTLVVDNPTSSSVSTNVIIPRPKHSKKLAGSFVWPKELLYSRPGEASSAVAWLAKELPERLFMPASNDQKAQLCYSLDKELSDEEYRLVVNTEAIGVFANSAVGFLYATISLLQLIVKSDAGELAIGCIEIDDQPRFPYRGFMLDCARQFHEKSSILKILDLMAAYKLNRFHWHLTDDEGWRIEIKAFPELTQIGAWRGADEVLEPQFGSGAKRYGGFYTHEDIREIVEYARQRHIMVIPEIDIPGHSRAAIKSLPEMLVEPEDRSSYYSAQMHTDNVLNPALPGTYTFLHAVLDEVCELFPAPYVHIGADEVPNGVWVQSPACIALMQQQGYNTALDLQGHLLRNLQDYLRARERQLIGWEEASHGDKLDHSAIICAWSGPTSIELTAKAGYHVIACPAPFAYLDMAWNTDVDEPGFQWAGTADLSICYSYEPFTELMDEAREKQIIGVQALLWSELVRSQERLEYMLFPRLFAMAETAWSAKGSKDWDSFQVRVRQHLARLEKSGVNHRRLENESV